MGASRKCRSSASSAAQAGAHVTGRKTTATHLGGLDLLAEFPGSFSVNSVISFWPAIEPTGSRLYVTEFSMDWLQAVTRIYELGTRHQYLVAGRAHGVWQANRIVGPRVTTTQFYNKFTPPCLHPQWQSWHIEGPAECGAADIPSEWSTNGSEIAGVGFQVSSGDFALLGSVRGTFIGLKGGHG
jgi:hypothetical protein